MIAADKFAGRWGFCGLCKKPSIKCEHCGMSSCSGGGCDKCHVEFEEASEIAFSEHAPPIRSMPYHHVWMKTELQLYEAGFFDD